MTPAWILDTFAAIMLLVAAVSAVRLVAARPWQRGAVITDTDISHLLMGIAMAGMLAASLASLPDDAWAVVFGVLAVWFGYRVVRDYQASGARALAGGHCAPHLVHAGAMLYMFAAVSAPAAHESGGMGGMSGGVGGMGTLELPFLALLFALVLVGYCIWDLDQVSGPGTSGHYSLPVARVAPPGPVLAGVGARAVGASGASAGLVSVAVSGPTNAPMAAPPVAEPAGIAQVPPASGPADGTGVLAPWVATACRIAMGVTMAFMLVIMI
jgi:Domain of unknown function (DUF5134)